MPQTYSKRRGAVPPPAGAVLVDRTTPWGNPFTMTHEGGAGIGSRNWACDEFEKYAAARLEREPGWLEPLRGKDLICWCQSPGEENPKRCHAQTLVRLADE